MTMEIEIPWPRSHKNEILKHEPRKLGTETHRDKIQSPYSESYQCQLIYLIKLEYEIIVCYCSG